MKNNQINVEAVEYLTEFFRLYTFPVSGSTDEKNGKIYLYILMRGNLHYTQKLFIFFNQITLLFAGDSIATHTSQVRSLCEV